MSDVCVCQHPRRDPEAGLANLARSMTGASTYTRIMAEHAVVIDISRYYPASGKRDELLSAMRQQAVAACDFEGCFGAQVCASDRDEQVLVAISRWASQQALDAFANSSTFVSEREGLISLLARPSEHEHLSSVS